MDKCSIIEKSIYPSVKRIIVIGDLHGDFNVICKALKISNLVKFINNSNGKRTVKWIGGDTHLVQLGDILDRYRGLITFKDEKSEYKIFKLLFNLKKQAKKVNGNVHLIIGNHEIMNIMGDYRYVSAEGHLDFSEYGNRKNALKPGGIFSTIMACNMKGVVKIGKYIFSHAGITVNTSKIGINNLNNKIRYMMLTGIYEPEILNTFWHRDFSSNPAKCDILEKSLYNLNAEFMIVGHSTHKNINNACNGKVWRVDTGMSSAFGKNNKVSVLEILKGNKFNVIVE